MSAKRKAQQILPERGDTLIACLAIALHPHLSSTDKAVAVILLDHFNRKTGQCDPGITRISALAIIAERSVIRSLDRLVHHKLFRRDRHGGNGNRNSYQPNWPAFAVEYAKYTMRKDVASRRTNLAVDQPPRSGPIGMLV